MQSTSINEQIFRLPLLFYLIPTPPPCSYMISFSSPSPVKFFPAFSDTPPLLAGCSSLYSRDRVEVEKRALTRRRRPSVLVEGRVSSTSNARRQADAAKDKKKRGREKRQQKLQDHHEADAIPILYQVSSKQVAAAGASDYSGAVVATYYYYSLSTLSHYPLQTLPHHHHHYIPAATLFLILDGFDIASLFRMSYM